MPLGKPIFRTAALVIALTAGYVTMHEPDSTVNAQSDNKRLVREAFDRWSAGTGGPFELLTDDASWTITGSSPVSKTYASKEDFMAGVIRPFNARMTQPLKPTVRGLHADGDTVVVLFDGASECVDGQPYRNTYAWFIRMEDGRAVEVTAFFDTRLFDEMWERVAPRPE